MKKIMIIELPKKCSTCGALLTPNDTIIITLPKSTPCRHSELEKYTVTSDWQALYWCKECHQKIEVKEEGDNITIKKVRIKECEEPCIYRAVCEDCYDASLFRRSW